MSTTLNTFNPQLRELGFCLEPGIFDKSQVAKMLAHLNSYLDHGHPGVVYESDCKIVRGVHGMHLYDAYFSSLVQSPYFVQAAEAILGEPVYLHQSKINFKWSKDGKSWPWHQDYVFWREFDGILHNSLVNIAVFLDDVAEDNGPLVFIPHTHHLGNISKCFESRSDWNKDLSAALTFQVLPDEVDPLIDLHGTKSVTGQAGDVVFFNPDTIHGSGDNLSDEPRRIMILTYNTCSNRPGAVASPRPEFLCTR
ncbi:TPA: phytanoyl-CoA dioxygenase family protein [Vibrio vulnificus]|nr:phytanoyl-CoA dioxygenase family protein [Vibrio vulnificus]